MGGWLPSPAYPPRMAHLLCCRPPALPPGDQGGSGRHGRLGPAVRVRDALPPSPPATRAAGNLRARAGPGQGPGSSPPPSASGRCVWRVRACPGALGTEAVPSGWGLCRLWQLGGGAAGAGPLALSVLGSGSVFVTTDSVSGPSQEFSMCRAAWRPYYKAGGWQRRAQL